MHSDCSYFRGAVLMIHTHVHTQDSFTYIQCLGEAGKQNILLLEREQVKLCFKVKTGEAQMIKFFG